MSSTGPSRASRYLGLALLLLVTACGHSKEPTIDRAVAGGISVSSPAFADGARLPVEYTCDGDGHAPELRWSGVPSGATSLAVVVDDPDAPGGTYVHWVVTGLDLRDTSLARDAHPAHASTWKPPCPPSGRTHHYHFTVYALDRNVRSTDARDVESHAIARGATVALFSR